MNKDGTKCQSLRVFCPFFNEEKPLTYLMFFKEQRECGNTLWQNNPFQCMNHENHGWDYHDQSHTPITCEKNLDFLSEIQLRQETLETLSWSMVLHGSKTGRNICHLISSLYLAISINPQEPQDRLIGSILLLKVGKPKPDYS